jgi:riboflavin biosynthesis pyrimidine reductase
MRMLLPELAGALSPAGIADAYAWPDPSRPWVRAVMVSTIDGAARSPSGLTAGISSAPDRLVFATMRGLSDVILVGAQTVRSEGYGPPRARPELAARREAAGQRPVARVAVVTGKGYLDTGSSLFQQATEPPLVFAPGTLPTERREALAATSEIVIAGEDRVEGAAIVEELAARGLRRITCEGGPTLLGQMAAAGLVDELCLTVTPLLSGGSYSDHPVVRILEGAPLRDSPRPMHLEHVIESDGTLFLRYLVSA